MFVVRLLNQCIKLAMSISENNLIKTKALVHGFPIISHSKDIPDNGELLLLHRFLRWPNGVRKYKAYRVDLRKRKTVPVAGLGGLAMFMGERQALSVPAGVFPTISANTVFLGFCFSERTRYEQISAYCLLNGRVEHIVPASGTKMDGYDPVVLLIACPVGFVAMEPTAAADQTVKKPVTTRSSKVFGAWTLEAAMLPICMTLVQVFTMVTLLLSKLALNAGMKPFVFLVYRNLVAAAAVAPLALIFERDMWEKVSLVICGWISVNSIFGIVLAMGLYYYGLSATGAAYSVNFLNLIPIVTFVMAIVFGSEKLVLAKWPGMMKLLGTLVCVCGAMIVSMFKGRLLHLWPTHLLRYSHGAQAASTASSASDGLHYGMAGGTVFLCGSCLSYGLWFVVQARLAKVFPSKYLVTTLTCLLGSLQSVVVGIFLNHGISQWKIKWDLQLLTVGVFNTAIPYVLNTWAISCRGPVYPSMFSSLLLVITTVMDSLLLGTNIYLGSVLGTLLIIVGLYAFLWGKAEELQLAATAKKLARSVQEAQEKSGDMA
ncbi:hypothetical protein PR202_ga29464 [Eleusine coracana subsp. coracana]|uniref:EamA domain-containing protein n=1 Tax=Eleusine coracana subsp. coracana TaxID=191504 RepID=A0AAV5DLF2_ELECO|nr:hypothetical protein PR202_ga29464 [Eleusine coracana subsp. coracana]